MSTRSSLSWMEFDQENDGAGPEESTAAPPPKIQEANEEKVIKHDEIYDKLSQELSEVNPGLHSRNMEDGEYKRLVKIGFDEASATSIIVVDGEINGGKDVLGRKWKNNSLSIRFRDDLNLKSPRWVDLLNSLSETIVKKRSPFVRLSINMHPLGKSAISLENLEDFHTMFVKKLLRTRPVIFLELENFALDQLPFLKDFNTNLRWVSITFKNVEESSKLATELIKTINHAFILGVSNIDDMLKSQMTLKFLGILERYDRPANIKFLMKPFLDMGRIPRGVKVWENEKNRYVDVFTEEELTNRES